MLNIRCSINHHLKLLKPQQGARISRLYQILSLEEMPEKSINRDYNWQLPQIKVKCLTLDSGQFHMVLSLQQQGPPVHIKLGFKMN